MADSDLVTLGDLGTSLNTWLGKADETGSAGTGVIRPKSLKFGDIKSSKYMTGSDMIQLIQDISGTTPPTPEGNTSGVHVGTEPPTDGSSVWIDTDDESDIAAIVTPIGTILAYGGTGTPTGWILCDGRKVSKGTYPGLFNVIGYTYGGSGDSFGIPDLTGKFLEGSSVAGTIHEAGLPNITGALNAGGDVDYTTAKSYVGSGAIEAINHDHPYAPKGSGNDTSWDGFTFDASRSNPIYGKSETVQPPSVTVRYIIKAYDTVSTELTDVEIEQQLDELYGEVSKTSTAIDNLATVATSGSYNDLSDKPTLAKVATSGSYNDLSNKPSITNTTYTISSSTNGKITLTPSSGSAQQITVYAVFA